MASRVGRAWVERIRLRAAVFVAGILLAAVATVSLTALPALPVFGVAVACAAVAINSIAQRLDRTVCYGCGHDLRGQAGGAHGVACPTCGAVNQSFIGAGRGPGGGGPGATA